MRLVRVSAAAAFGLGLLLAIPCAMCQRTVIGVLPVYDNSAQALTENLPINLTYMIYRDLEKNPAYDPVMLMPGGLYDPDSLDFVTDYAAKAGVDVVLITSILPCIKVNDRHCRLRLDARLVNVSSGKSSTKGLVDTVEIANSDLFNTVVGTTGMGAYVGFFSVFKGPDEFEKQPLGKAARKLVEWTRGYIDSSLPSVAATPSGRDSDGKPGTCPVDFHIHYIKRNAISKSYTLIVNDKDESTTNKEGIAHFPEASGRLAMRIEVKDAPYGMPVPKLYQASTLLDCSSSQHTLVMEMGNAGDALLHWQ